MSTTALAIITRAFEILEVFQPGESIDPAQSESARGFLNLLIDSWTQQSLTIPAIAREIFHVVAGQGGPSNPYTIGVGGSFNTPRPPMPENLTGAGLLLNSSVPALEIPRSVVTDDGYRSLRAKELQNSLWTAVYYSPTFAGDLGTINLWPVPNTALNDLVLYLKRPLTAFADLTTTTYQLPDGAEDALVYNLARRLAKPWGATLDEETKQLASNALRIFKRSHLHLSDLSSDFARNGGAGRYNIELGNR